jgi:rare lipoprotein A (peptidoglycan hydrolase)
MAGCGAASTRTVTSQAVRTEAAVRTQPAVWTQAALPKGHPHVLQPVAGAVPTAPASKQTPAGPAAPSSDPHPTGPATITMAPAKGAPTDAQVRAAIARFHSAVARYHLNRLDFSNVLIDPAQLPRGHWYVSIASVYTDYGRPIACGGVLHVPQLGVANKTLPCGTEVTFDYAGRAIRVPVIDRGPYIAGREWDLTGATAEALHFPGLGPIKWRIG